MPVIDSEDELLLDEDQDEIQPVRIIEFPRGFHARLNECPRHVARITMSTLGSIAAVDPAGFAGGKRLRRRPDVIRQRCGDYRLLFQLAPDRVVVIDLIPRQDLERRIKSLPGT